jgi:hypothetical protein
MATSRMPSRVAAHLVSAVLVPVLLVSGVVLGAAYLGWKTRDYFILIVLLCAAVGGAMLTRAFASRVQGIVFGLAFTVILAVCLGLYWLYLYCFLTLDCP